MPENCYTLEEAANLLGVTLEELDRMRQENQVPAIEELGVWYFPTDAIQTLAQTGPMPAISSAGGSGSGDELELEPIRVDTDLGGGLNPVSPGELNALDTSLAPTGSSGSDYVPSQEEIGSASSEPMSESLFEDFSDSIFPEDNASPRRDTGGGPTSPDAGPKSASSLPPTLDYPQSDDLLGASDAPAGPALFPETPAGPAAGPSSGILLQASAPAAGPSSGILREAGSVTGPQPDLLEPTFGPLEQGSSGSDDLSLQLDEEGIPLSPVVEEPASPSSAGPLGSAPLQETADLLPSEDSLDFSTAPPASGGSQVQLGAAALGGSGALSPTMPRLQPAGQQDARLDVETGSFEFSLNVESSPKLQEQASTSGTAPGLSEAPGGDSDVRLDFDPTLSSDDDSLIGVGDRPDSDVRLEPGSAAPADDFPELSKTEQIDLDAELRQAEEASLARRGTGTPQGRSTQSQPSLTGPKSGPLKTRAPAPPTPTMLPSAGSPFELSMDDLDVSGGSLGVSAPGSGGADLEVPMAGGSEFELTLAPEEESPLSLGDDEGVDLGAMPARSDSSSSSKRAELSGIHKHVPVETGVDESEQVDFELTIDEDPAAGPKTIKGKLTDSDSEFELTIDEGGSGTSLPRAKTNVTGEQKDIFESTEFDLQAPGLEEESASQAVALHEPDTDLESSDFDLAVEESVSQALEGDAASVDSSLSVEESLSVADSLADSDLASSDEEAPLEADDEAVPTVPAAQAEWGMVPLIMLVPCVLVMFMGLLMSYELLHNMWGYHQASKPTGLLVEGFANLFKAEGGN